MDENEKKTEELEEAAETAGETSEAEETETSDAETETEPETDISAELEALRAENLSLKAQLAAHREGFRTDCSEDAVLLAQHAAEREGTDIESELKAVARKYPEWLEPKGDTPVKGIRIGSPTPPQETAGTDDSLDEAFGLRRRK